MPRYTFTEAIVKDPPRLVAQLHNAFDDVVLAANKTVRDVQTTISSINTTVVNNTNVINNTVMTVLDTSAVVVGSRSKIQFKTNDPISWNLVDDSGIAAVTISPVLNYNATNLQLTAGQLNTIQDISPTSSPTFANITATVNATVQHDLEVDNSLLLLGLVGNGLLYLNNSQTTVQIDDVAAGQYLRSTGTTSTPSWTSPAALTKVDDTNVTVTLGGTPASSLFAAVSLTMGWTGTLADARLSTTAVTPGSYGSATEVGAFTVTGTGRLTAAANVTVTPAAGSITGAQNLSLGSSLQFTAGTGAGVLLAAATVDTVQDIRTTASPQFKNMGLNFAPDVNFALVLKNISQGIAILSTTGDTLFSNDDTSITVGADFLDLIGPDTGTQRIIFEQVDGIISLKAPALLTTSQIITFPEETGTVALSSTAIGTSPTFVNTYVSGTEIRTAPTSVNSLTVGVDSGFDGDLTLVAWSDGTRILMTDSEIRLSTASTTYLSMQTDNLSNTVLWVSNAKQLLGVSLAATGNVYLSAGVSTAPTWGKVGLTTHVSGILPTANGGTNISTYTLGDILYSSAANVLSKLAGNTTSGKQYLSQTGTGTVSAAPAWASIAGADVTGAELTKADDTNVTLTLGGTPTTALLRAASITAGWTGTLAISRGGSGLGTTPTDGQLLIGKTSTNAYVLATLTGTANQITVTNGSGTITLALPQNYDTAAAPQLARLGLGAAADANVLLMLTKTGTQTSNMFEIKTGTTPAYSQVRISNNSVAGCFAVLSYTADNTQISFDADWVSGGWVARHGSCAWIEKAAGLMQFAGSSGNSIGSTATQTTYLTLDLATGNFYSASGTTGMTTGFFCIPAAAGAPTGAVTNPTGRVAMYYDTTNNKFYVRSGAAWKSVALT